MGKQSKRVAKDIASSEEQATTKTRKIKMAGISWRYRQEAMLRTKKLLQRRGVTQRIAAEILGIFESSFNCMLTKGAISYATYLHLQMELTEDNIERAKRKIELDRYQRSAERKARKNDNQ